MSICLRRIAVIIFILPVSSVLNAGAYIFAGEGNGLDVITHPNTYTGNDGVVTVRVCIDPASLNATDMEYSVQNNIDTFNQMTPTLGNVKRGGNNNIPSGALDFESVSLHEIGHCIGMAHINAASESGLTGDNQNYTKATDGVAGQDIIPANFDLDAGADGVIGSSDDIRGNDENLVWFRKENNDPFTMDAVIDSTTYSRDLADLPTGHTFAANADRAVSTHLGYTKTEAVMQQGTYPDEAQRTLGHDDVATLRYAASGINELENDGNNPNAQDNYTINLVYGGISSSNCDIRMSMKSDADGLAVCKAGGAFMASGHIRITTASIEFDDGFNWFFNSSNAAPVLAAVGNLTLTENDVLVVPVSASDSNGDGLVLSSVGLPPFVSLFDNGDGTGTVTISPVLGDASNDSFTLTVTDDGSPVLFDDEVIEITVVALDTDLDGISDYDEINIYGTSEILADTDDDSLNDYQEIFVYLTLALDADSDNDLLSDGIEVNNGTDPNDILDWPVLADGDLAPLGQPDGLINAADYLLLQRIVLGDLGITNLELSHGDLYPPGSPDGLINVQDMILLLKLIQ